MTRRILAIISALLLTLYAYAQIEITDSDQNTVALQQVPERSAVLFSSYAEMWLDAGGTVSVTVGETIERGFASDGTPLVDSGAGKSINTELLIAYSPDLVICSADIPAQAEAARLLNSAGIPAVCFRVESLEDYIEVFGVMTRITGNEAAYMEKALLVSESAKTIIRETAKAGSTYAFIRTGSSSSSAKLKQSSEHFVCGMLNEFGLTNIADSGFVASGNINPESLLASDPDYLFISIMGDEEAGTAYALQMISLPEWQVLSCVQNGRVSILPKELFHYKPNSRWADAYRYLSELLTK